MLYTIAITYQSVGLMWVYHLLICRTTRPWTRRP